MKALTLHQPWASLIAVQLKTIETRSWPTKYRGPMAIHAGKRRMNGVDELRLWYDNRDALESQLDTDNWETLPLGMVVATAILIDVVPTGRVGFVPPSDPWVITKGWHRASGDFDYTARQAQREMGDFTPGRWAWVFDDIQASPIPIIATGHQGLWDWDVRTNP